MTTKETKEVRQVINDLDRLNTQLLELLQDFYLQDDEKYTNLVDAIYNLETEITECQELNGWI
jgi:hypothetical protein